MSKTSDIQIRLMRAAIKSPDWTILSVGFNKADPDGAFPSFPQSTANALVKRGFLVFVKKAAWGTVYRLTPTGEQYVRSLPKT